MEIPVTCEVWLFEMWVNLRCFRLKQLIVTTSHMRACLSWLVLRRVAPELLSNRQIISSLDFTRYSRVIVPRDVAYCNSATQHVIVPRDVAYCNSATQHVIVPHKIAYCNSATQHVIVPHNSILQQCYSTCYRTVRRSILQHC